MKLLMAGLRIELAGCRSPRVAALCRGYEADFAEANLTVSVDDAEIDAECAAAGGCDRGYAEATCFYRAIARRLPLFDAFVLHASAVALDGRAYAFAAPSGTGKSTHTALWRRAFGERVAVINGDKPILRLCGGRFYAFGTPFCGKEGWGSNTSAPLAALCFLERGRENRIEPLDPDDAVPRLAGQVIIPRTAEAAGRFLELLNLLAETVPFYLLHCNTEPEAALVALRGMEKGARA